ncbi:MAG TPA: hypothetical protein DCG41_09410 [Verrucomicrobiales bacterium]|nr:hypothetical protein [Verrucomicrobiales bacterium]
MSFTSVGPAARAASGKNSHGIAARFPRFHFNGPHEDLKRKKFCEVPLRAKPLKMTWLTLQPCLNPAPGTCKSKTIE